MRTTVEYLDAVKAALRVESDYAAAKELGVTRAAVSRYRTGVSTFDDEVAFRIAEIIGVNPLEVIIASRAERAKSESQRHVWEGHWEHFSKSFRSRVSPANAHGVSLRWV